MEAFKLPEDKPQRAGEVIMGRAGTSTVFCVGVGRARVKCKRRSCAVSIDGHAQLETPDTVPTALGRRPNGRACGV